MRCLIVLLILILMSCGRGKTDKDQADRSFQEVTIANINDFKLAGSWQSLDRNELLIFKKDKTVQSLFCNMSGLWRVVYKDNFGNYKIEINNFAGEYGDECYKKGIYIYNYRYNNWGNLEISFDGKTYEFTRES